ncbi:MAG: iron uptake porin [Xenococcus sp. (in: cyanobacteria)]
MKSQLKASLLSSSAVIGVALLASGTTVLAQEFDSSSPYGDSLEYVDPMLGDTTDFNSVDSLDESMSQVTNVNQLRDVSPADWAYEALRSLVDRYGCIVGYPDQTYRGNNALSRYEFAAGLNACLNQIERLIASSEAVLREDIETINRLIQEFEAELAALTGRVDNLEGRVAFLEDNQFSTTTKLVGEVAFTLADAFSDDSDAQTVFTDKVRLQLVSSFTGKDKLFTRLTAGNIANSFQDEIGTREGRFAYDGPANNNIVLDRLHYVFNLGDNLKVTTMASLAAHHFYADTFNAGLDVGGGANGPLGRFAERNPLYRHTINRNSVGAGATYKFGTKAEVSAGYIARNGSNPSDGNGLFNGTYSAMGQLVFKPTDNFKFGVNYLRGYDDNAGATLWGGTGTNVASGSDLNGEALTSDSVGGQFQWDVSSKVSLRGWFGYTDSQTVDSDTDQETLTYAGIVAFPDLGKEGNLGGIIVGAEPYVTQIDGDDPSNDDVPLHVEAFYRYQINDNVSITPGLIYLSNPNQNSNNDDVIIGAIRTTFKF